jgi:hypothetical protein
MLLGAALALIDSVFLQLHLPADTTIKTFAYGLPRVNSPLQKKTSQCKLILTFTVFEVGNQQFADYVDAKLCLQHINNKKVFIFLKRLSNGLMVTFYAGFHPDPSW